ncbi:MAG: hypothetical protein NT079_07345 [Candidatus Omnitrophica bacterium]|nr:hypothetical protein [Candidatus Omnitrophota bacterium]
MRKIIFKVLILFYCGSLFGCMRFTQEDYDLQKKKYEREQKAEEQHSQNSMHIKW